MPQEASIPAGSTSAAVVPSLPEIPSLKVLLGHPKFHQLLYQLFHSGQGAGNLEGLLMNFVKLLAEHTLVKKELGSPVWQDLRGNLPFHVGCECCSFVFEGRVYLLAPRPTLLKTIRSRKVMAKDIAHGLVEIEMEDGVELASIKEISLTETGLSGAKVFRKLPHFFVIESALYVFYPDSEFNPVLTVAKLDLKTFRFSAFPVSGRLPVVPNRGLDGTEAVLYEGFVYVVLAANRVFRINLLAPIPSWESFELTGKGPLLFTGGSLLWKDQMMVISPRDHFVYFLSLKTLEWQSRLTTGCPALMFRDCYLSRVYENELVLLRKSDYSELWKLNLQTLAWRKDQVSGTRPGNYATNPSYVIHKDTVFCLGGQVVGRNSSKNHMKYLNLRRIDSGKEKKLSGKIARMFGDPYGDICFEFDDGSHLRAHRSILCQTEYFRAQLSSNYAEGQWRKMIVGQSETQCCFVPIREVDSKVFGALVEFLYERLDFSTTEVDLAVLYQVADRFMISELMEEIVGHFEAKLGGEDMLRLYEKMFETAAPRTQKRKAENTIARDFSKISKTEGFTALCKRHADDIPDFKDLSASFE